MKQQFLGDSYDLVKRFWAQSLSQIAPLYAHPNFIPVQMQSAYTHLTGINILKINPSSNLAEPPSNSFTLFLDPCIGVPLPTGRVTSNHSSLPFIVQEVNRLKPHLTICFDQSHHRGHQLNPLAQIQAKMDFLSQHSLHSFYFDSHARFFFIADSQQNLGDVKSHLISQGLPAWRFKP